MNIDDGFARCLAYLGSQSQLVKVPVPIQQVSRMAVAISRQTGAGALGIAQRLAVYLQAAQEPGEPPWTVFDKNLIDKVLEDQQLPARLAKFLPEDRINAINDIADEILGLHPPSWLIIHQATGTILRLAEMGNVILLGRGAGLITGRLPNVLRVRMVGSLEQRVARVQEAEHLNREAALAFVRRNDRGRARYVRKYLHQDVADVLRYDLTLNTDQFSEDEAAHTIGEIVLSRLASAGSNPGRQAA